MIDVKPAQDKNAPTNTARRVQTIELLGGVCDPGLRLDRFVQLADGSQELSMAPQMIGARRHRGVPSPHGVVRQTENALAPA